jgi:hypothetical protein
MPLGTRARPLRPFARNFTDLDYQNHSRELGRARIEGHCLRTARRGAGRPIRQSSIFRAARPECPQRLRDLFSAPDNDSVCSQECIERLRSGIAGYGQASDHARAMKAGFDEHLVKPPDASRIGELIDKLVQGNRLRGVDPQ